MRLSNRIPFGHGLLLDLNELKYWFNII